MLGRIVEHVAALAEGDEVAASVAGGVVIAVSSGQDDLRRPHGSKDVVSADPDAEDASAPITPAQCLSVLPASVAEVEHALPVRAPVRLAATACAPEADHGRELRPVDGVEEAVLAPDRHRALATMMTGWTDALGSLRPSLARRHSAQGTAFVQATADTLGSWST